MLASPREQVFEEDHNRRRLEQQPRGAHKVVRANRTITTIESPRKEVIPTATVYASHSTASKKLIGVAKAHLHPYSR